MKKFLSLSAVMLLAGCTFANHYYVSDNVATLANGDEIRAGSEIHQQSGKATAIRDYAIWRRDGKDKELALTSVRGWSHEGEWGQLHRSSDGNQVWFTKDGQTTASFDYINATAVVGIENQPEWAK